MFEAKDDIADAVDKVYALTDDLKRGDILTHAAIRQVLGLAPHEGRWDHILRRVRRRLEKERGIATWPATTVGYKLLTESEQLRVPQWRSVRALRQVRRGRKSVQALPTAGLTDHQKRLREFLIDRDKEVERSMRDEAKVREVIFKPSQVIPRRNPVS